MSRKVYKYVWIMMCVLFVGIGVFAFGKKADAASTFKIRINKQQNVVTIYKLDENGKYKPYKAMLCSVGYGTPVGKFSLKEKIRWHELDGPVYGQYCTRITGHILFHSVWYYQYDPRTLSYAQYNKLGQTASHGCVRLNVRDSKWIYDYMASGTPVEIYNSSNPGPLGKPEPLRVSGSTGWDPTDETNPSNPYNKKKPVIKFKPGMGKKDIIFGSSVNLLSMVTAKNTTGFDITSKVTYTVKYKELHEKSYRKVKKFNTKRAGLYRIKFAVKDQMGRKGYLTRTFSVMNKVPTEAFTLSNKSKTLYLGGKKKYTYFKLALNTITPEDASIRTLAYKSMNENIATVDANGKVTAVAPGRTKIRAKTTDGTGIKVYCKIYVRKYATGVTLSIEKESIAVGETTKLTPGVEPEDATGKKSAAFEYTSSDPSIATVDEEGVVTGVAPGSTAITVTGKNYARGKKDIYAQVFVTVTEGSTDVATPGAIDVTPEATAQPTAQP